MIEKLRWLLIAYTTWCALAMAWNLYSSATTSSLLEEVAGGYYSARYFVKLAICAIVLWVTWGLR